MYLLFIIIGICTTVNGIAGIVLKCLRSTISPLDFYSFHIAVHTGSYFNFKKYIQALGGLGLGETSMLLICGVLLTLLGFLCRRLPPKMQSSNRISTFFKYAVLIVFPLLFVAFTAPILVQYLEGIGNVWKYLWSKGIILHAPASHKPVYYRALSFVICYYSFSLYSMHCYFCTLQQLHKARLILGIFLFPLFLIVGLGVTWFIYPLVGVILPLLLLIVGLIILICFFEIGGSFSNSNNESNNLEKLIEEKKVQEHEDYIRQLEKSLYYNNTLSPLERHDLFEAAAKGETKLGNTYDWYEKHAHQLFDYGDSPDDE